MATLEDSLKFGQVFHDQIRSAGLELLGRIEPREDGTGPGSTVFRGFNVMLHIADEQGFLWCQLVGGDEVGDLVALVMNADIGVMEEGVKAGELEMGFEMARVNG